MYAIVDNGGKQYKAEIGSVIRFEKLCANVGDKVEFEVLMVSDENGIKVADEAKGFKAVGEVLEQGKEKKIVIFIKDRDFYSRGPDVNTKSIVHVKPRQLKILANERLKCRSFSTEKSGTKSIPVRMRLYIRKYKMTSYRLQFLSNRTKFIYIVNEFFKFGYYN